MRAYDHKAAKRVDIMAWGGAEALLFQCEWWTAWYIFFAGIFWWNRFGDFGIASLSYTGQSLSCSQPTQSGVWHIVRRWQDEPCQLWHLCHLLYMYRSMYTQANKTLLCSHYSVRQYSSCVQKVGVLCSKLLYEIEIFCVSMSAVFWLWRLYINITHLSDQCGRAVCWHACKDGLFLFSIARFPLAMWGFWGALLEVSISTWIDNLCASSYVSNRLFASTTPPISSTVQRSCYTLPY